MKLKLNPLPIVLAGFFTVIYVFAAAFPLSKEVQFSPEWTVSVSNQVGKWTEEKPLPFKVGQVAGYFNKSGDILNFTSFPVKIAISEKFYAPYGLSNDEISVYSPDGNFVCKMESSGFPFIDEDRLFVFLPGGASFSQFSTEGKKLWTYEGFIPVTSFASSKAGAAAGFADGKVLVFNQDGSVKLEFVPGGSKYSVILGLDISADGSMIACLSGLEKQRIVLSRMEKEHSVITFYKYLEKDQIRQSFVQFSETGEWLYYSFEGGLGIVKCSNGKNTEIKMAGIVTSLKPTNIPGTFFVLTKSEDGKTKTVYLIENYTKNSGSFSFEADSAFIETDGTDLFIGRDSRISKIRVHKD